MTDSDTTHVHTVYTHILKKVLVDSSTSEVLCKYKELGSTTGTHGKRLGVVAQACHCSAGEERKADP